MVRPGSKRWAVDYRRHRSGDIHGLRVGAALSERGAGRVCHGIGPRRSLAGWAASVAEIEVDPITFEIKVTRYYTTHEIGKAINYDQAVAQIQGGSLQGIGYALYEKIELENGQFDVTGFTDYIIPTLTDALHGTPWNGAVEIKAIFPFGR